MGAIEQASIRVTPSGKISRRAFAELVGRKVQTVSAWARTGVGPAPVLVNGRAFYDFVEASRFAAGEEDVRANSQEEEGAAT